MAEVPRDEAEMKSPKLDPDFGVCYVLSSSVQAKVFGGADQNVTFRNLAT